MIGAGTSLRPSVATAPNEKFVCCAHSQEAPKGQPESNKQQQDGSNNAEAKNSQPESKIASDLLSVLGKIETAIRESKPKEDKAEEESKTKREKEDLQAQQDMVYWAEKMFWAAVAAAIIALGGVGATSVGIYLVWKTLGETKRAAIAAEGMLVQAVETTKAAQEAGKAAWETVKVMRQDQRAWITISVRPEKITVNEDGKLVALVYVYGTNIGRSPAQNVRIRSKAVSSIGSDSIAELGELMQKALHDGMPQPVVFPKENTLSFGEHWHIDPTNTNTRFFRVYVAIAYEIADDHVPMFTTAGIDVVVPQKDGQLPQISEFKTYRTGGGIAT